MKRASAPLRDASMRALCNASKLWLAVMMPAIVLLVGVFVR